MQICKKCNQNKPFDQYYSSKAEKGRRRSVCKECWNSSTGAKGKWDYMFGGNREKVILRDGEKCVKCGMSRSEHKEKYGRDLAVDHINGIGTSTSRDVRDNRMENLQTLCSSCHGKKEIVNRYTAPLPIWQMKLNGEKVRKWDSAMDVQRSLGINNSRINLVLSGYRNQAGGFKWEYAENRDKIVKITGFSNLDREGGIEITFEDHGEKKALVLDQSKVKDMEMQIKFLKGSYNYLGKNG